MSILPELAAFLGNLLSLIIFGILFQQITKNKLSVMEWVMYIKFMDCYINYFIETKSADYKFVQKVRVYEGVSR